ncbi:neprilysin-3-like isoform X2 [Dermacentor silvarum]|uniref:neprilysin-3-like isoform X2 n=1 Tax=Dermacentor silvarum TaxID=543639 RepID=UPI002100AC45|nr:neprilysin-3-like isoform X2 [Dermacentor silvarum]
MNEDMKWLKRLLVLAFGVNYAKTLNEDIVDNGGLNTSFMVSEGCLQGMDTDLDLKSSTRFAYSKVLKDECDDVDTRLQGLEYFSGAQLFFVSWAMTFCRNVSKDGILYQIKETKHSPEQLRVNLALRNFKRFAEVFGCSNTSYMNPPNKERCTLW